MTKKLVQHGNSVAIVIEKPILQLLNIGMETNLEIVTDGKNIIISPSFADKDEDKLIESLSKINKKHRATLEKLAK